MSAYKDLLLATNNTKKVQEIRQILGNSYTGRIFTAAEFPSVPEPEETGSTFAENAKIKSDYYWTHTGLISLADDSGLVVDALDGRPGVFSARYAETDELRITKLLTEMQLAPSSARTARFQCAICVTLSSERHLEQAGALEGYIGIIPKGAHGFGYDPIFHVGNGDRTLAELQPEEKNSVSHRAEAMKKVQADLLNALMFV